MVLYKLKLVVKFSSNSYQLIAQIRNLKLRYDIYNISTWIKSCIVKTRFRVDKLSFHRRNRGRCSQYCSVLALIKKLLRKGCSSDHFTYQYYGSRLWSTSFLTNSYNILQISITGSFQCVHCSMFWKIESCEDRKWSTVVKKRNRAEYLLLGSNNIYSH